MICIMKSSLRHLVMHAIISTKHSYQSLEPRIHIITCENMRRTESHMIQIKYEKENLMKTIQL